MPNPRMFHFKLPPYQGAPLPEPPNSFYPGVQAHWIASTSDRLRRSDGKVRAFVIHATAGGSSSGAMSVMFAHKASWHWLVPDENEPEHGRLVWACAPEKRAAIHVRNDRSHPDVNSGSRFVNYWSLGVEVVNTQQNDQFSEWQIEQTAALVRYAWSRYPEMRDVVSHAKLDPARRSDPGTHFKWDRFQELVLAPVPATRSFFFGAASVAEEPITIIGLRDERIECDPHLSDGVTVVEARPLIEALGFSVVYDEEAPMTMRILAHAPAKRRNGTNGKGVNGTGRARKSKKTGAKKRAPQRAGV